MSLIIAFVSAILFVTAYLKLPKNQLTFVLPITCREGAKKNWHSFQITANDSVFCLLSAFVSLVPLVMLESLKIDNHFIVILFATLGLAAPYVGVHVARYLNHQRHEFSITSVIFAITMLTPVIIVVVAIGYGGNILLPLISIISIYLALLEASARTICVARQCCHGKSIRFCTHPFPKYIFNHFYHKRSDETQKIQYKVILQEVKSIPVQAIASGSYTLASILGILLFYLKLYFSAIAVTTLIHYGSRIFLEIYRDHDQDKVITKFQKMSLVNMAIFWVIGLIALIATSPKTSLEPESLKLWMIIFFLFYSVTALIVNLKRKMFSFGRW